MPLVRDEHGVWQRHVRRARAGRALRPARRRPARPRARVQPGAHAARPVRPRPRARGRRLVAGRRARSLDGIRIRLGRRREAARAARPHGHLRGARAGFSKRNPPFPSRCTARTPASRTTRRSSTSPGSASRPSSCCRCTRSSTEQRLRASRGSRTTGATTRSLLRAARAVRHGRGPARGRRRGAARVRGHGEAACTRPGLEVILDVVYNHTAEEGRRGARRTRSAASTTRRTTGTTRTARYVDVTGCGNTLDFGDGRRRSASCSTRCATWPRSCRSTASASTSPRRSAATTTALHARPSAAARRSSTTRCSRASKLIAEPWDVGLGGWQTGNFPATASRSGTTATATACATSGSATCAANARPAPPAAASAASRPGSRAPRTRSRVERGPLASLNFVTAHDGFTLADLTAYDVKHNLGNGEHNRDGTDNNHSYNHGVEGETDDAGDPRGTPAQASGTCSAPCCSRRACRCSPPATSSAARQRGNNNAYCHDSELTWLVVGRDDDRDSDDLLAHDAAAASGCAPRTRRCARCASARFGETHAERLADGLVQRRGRRR